MPRYLLQVSYTADGVKGVAKDGGSKRRDAARALVESLGGTLETFYFAFGTADAFAIVDLPDGVSAAAASMTVSASGGGASTITVLLTAEEIIRQPRSRPTTRRQGGSWIRRARPKGRRTVRPLMHRSPRWRLALGLVPDGALHRQPRLGTGSLHQQLARPPGSAVLADRAAPSVPGAGSEIQPVRALTSNPLAVEDLAATIRIAAGVRQPQSNLSTRKAQRLQRVPSNGDVRLSWRLRHGGIGSGGAPTPLRLWVALYI